MKLTAKITAGYLICALLFISVCMIFGTAAVSYVTDPAAAVSVRSDTPVFIIDPGHGGEDGGAASGNILEKDLNLTVARNLADICTIFGQTVKLTRNTDTLLHDAFDDLEDYSGKKKTYDLKNRLRMAEESGAGLFIGIHMNKFPQESSKGLQVYYTPNADNSENAARMIQNYTKTHLTPWNSRETKKATSSIYLLHRIQIPAVLVECGFLSNPEECRNLCDPAYQAKLAAVIFSAASEWIGSAG